MRSFVITMPGLSVARPGQIRSADELQMDDDQLDAFVEAGYALEVFSEEAEPAPDTDEPDTDEPEEPDHAATRRRRRAAPDPVES